MKNSVDNGSEIKCASNGQIGITAWILRLAG